jgi:3-oxoacyl-[acyl-carrier-protein] synthase III
MYSRILGTGSYLPERVLTNADLERMVDTTDDWIRTRTGIERRHLASEEQTTCDLAEAAARRAMQAAGVVAADIDLIALGTTTPDQVFPNTACLLQSRLGIAGPPAIQVEAACTGFIYALSIADKFIRLGEAKCALVIGAECLSRLVDWTDRGTCVLFGDGAGAVVLAPSERPGIRSTHLHANGAYADLLFYPTGPSLRHNAAVKHQEAIHMKGAEVFKVAVNTLAAVIEETLSASGLDRSAIDWFIPHQANLRLIEAVARKLHLPMEQVIVTVREHGNTSAASLPIALDCAIQDGRVEPGQLLMLAAFGGGFTWGSALLRL